MKKRSLTPIFLCLVITPSLAQSPTKEFDEERAFKSTQKQVEFGPRPSGSPELQRTREWIEGELRSYGLETQEQVFTQDTPRGPIRFVNISAQIPREGFLKLIPDQRKIVVLASHYDTKWMPKIRFLGANDGASSTAVLLEIARVMVLKKSDFSKFAVHFIFFDGEEAMENYGPDDGLFGSKYCVQQAKNAKWLSRVQAMILADMVGSRDLSLQIRPPADAELTQKVFEAAEQTGSRDLVRIEEMGMIDDHSPFVQEGVPVIDLIDFRYGPQNRWWHTSEDTLDKISAKSLGMTGRIVLKMLENWK